VLLILQKGKKWENGANKAIRQGNRNRLVCVILCDLAHVILYS